MNSIESQKKPQPWAQTAQRLGKARQKLELWTGVIGNRALDAHERETRLNREAESAHIRKTMWEGKNQSDEDMGDQTILGDVNHPAPIVVQGGGNNGNNSLLTLALGAVLGGGGIFLGQMLSKPVIPSGQVTPIQQQSQPAANQDTMTTIGLGRIEDYLGQSGAGK